MFKKLLRKLLPNPLDRMLKRAQKEKARTVLITWNRGVGDIALGLYAIVLRIREFLPDSKITFITRPDLQEGFKLLAGVDLLIGSDWRRGVAFNLDKTLREHNLSRSDFDCIIENPDPTYWVSWQLGKVTPKLVWNDEWDQLWKSFPLFEEKSYVGVHVQTETAYAPGRNWPLDSWKELFKQLSLTGEHRIVLFGYQQTPRFEDEAIIDLRGKTTLFELLSIVKNRCNFLIAPDSGVLTLSYFLDIEQPLHLISLWSNPRNGILKQNVPSPNPYLKHTPLRGMQEDIRSIAVSDVFKVLEEKR